MENKEKPPRQDKVSGSWRRLGATGSDICWRNYRQFIFTLCSVSLQPSEKKTAAESNNFMLLIRLRIYYLMRNGSEGGGGVVRFLLNYSHFTLSGPLIYTLTKLIKHRLWRRGLIWPENEWNFHKCDDILIFRARQEENTYQTSIIHSRAVKQSTVFIICSWWETHTLVHTGTILYAADGLQVVGCGRCCKSKWGFKCFVCCRFASHRGRPKSGFSLSLPRNSSVIAKLKHLHGRICCGFKRSKTVQFTQAD